MPEGLTVAFRILRLIAAEQEKEAARWHAAEKVARRLLLANLTPTQRRCDQAYRWFEARGSATGAIYRIHTHKYLGNIWDIRANRKYCICIGDRKLPLSDHILAQKLLVETNEPMFLRTANVTRLA